MDGIKNGWDLERKLEELNSMLIQNDETATAVRRENENILDISYKDHTTVIPLENEYESEQIFNGVMYKGEHIFSGNDFVNTGICLYSEENINKNFEISFDIVDLGTTNVDQSTILSSMNEAGDPWPGHNVKITSKSGKTFLKIESNSNTSSTGDVTIPDTVKNVKIIRINHILYYSFDGKECFQLNDFTGFTNYFDVPVTFGCALDKDNKSFRYFNGKLSNMYIRFLDDNITIANYNPNKKPLVTKYQHQGEIVFDGQKNIKTDILLFDENHIDKDFEISFKIEELGKQLVDQATLFNAKYEVSPFPGFVYRIATDKKLEFTAKGGTEINIIKNSANTVNSVIISREGTKIFVRINNGDKIEAYDLTGFKDFHNMPLIIGSSVKSDGQTYFRYFVGKLSNIVIKVEPD